MPACPFESIFNHGDLVFWEAWGEEKGEILFLPLVLKRYLFELDNSPVSGQITRLPLAPATFARLPFVSVQHSRRREPAATGDTRKTAFNLFPPQLSRPVACPESSGFCLT